MTASVLRVDGLSLRYDAVLAVNQVSLEVGAGQVVSVVGANGAGKSSLLAAIVGLRSPSGGTVEFKATRITGKRPEKIAQLGISLVPEQRRVFGSLSVYENLAVGGSTRKKADAEADIEMALDVFPGLKDRFRFQAAMLSGGEQQQLAIARALVSRPSLLLLDEPSLGLAPQLVNVVYHALERLVDEYGISILLVEQNVRRAARFASITHVMRNGSFVMSGTWGQISTDSRLLHAYLGAEAQT